MFKESRPETFTEGRRYKASVVDMSSEGWGIGKSGVLTIFLNSGIPAIPGDEATFTLTKQGKSFAYGEVTRIDVFSPQRRETQCAYSEECGGCALQIMDYESQLALKHNIVANTLKRIGKIKDPFVKPTLGMKTPVRYRNKAQFPVGPRGEVGFYKSKSHEVVDCKSCIIQSEAAEKAAAAVRRYIQKEKISIYDAASRKGLLRHVMARVGMYTGDVMVVLVVNDENLPDFRGLPEVLAAEIDTLKTFEVEFEGKTAGVKWRLKSVIINFNRGNTSRVMGEKCVTIYGEDRIIDVFDGKKMEISPHSFFQVNPTQMKPLYDTVMSYAALTGSETVVDAYCGVGGIGISLAPYARRVIGIESEKSAVADARRNAAMNGISNIEFICDRSEYALSGLKKKGIDIQAAVLDPPAGGCDKRVLASLADAKPRRIVYVSCNPATLARDLQILRGYGYEFKEAQPVDMFPQTMSVECVAWLEYKQPEAEDM